MDDDDILGAALNLALGAIVLTLEIALWLAGLACIVIAATFEIFLPGD